MKASQRTVKEKDQFVVAMICPLAQICVLKQNSNLRWFSCRSHRFGLLVCDADMLAQLLPCLNVGNYTKTEK
jgi:hypothetical protein